MRRPTLGSGTPLIPARLLGRLRGGPSGDGPSVDGPRLQEFEGVALQADIVGFTPLAERLGADGEAGIERLSALLNLSFERWVELVYAHGGEVVAFAGDALTAIWLPGDRVDVVRAARDCMAALRATTERSDAVRLHLGAAVGPFWAARVGGHLGRWHVAVGGAAVDAASVETDGVRELAPLHGRPLPPDRGSSSWLRRHEPAVLAGRLLGDWTAEFRPLASFFVRIRRLHLDQPGAVIRLQAAVEVAQKVLHEHGGLLDKVMVVGPDAILHAAHGLPGHSRGDDVEQAADAVLEIAAALDRYGLGVHVGLAAGRAFCGLVGGERRVKYMLVGPLLNTAARLMQSGAARILATAEVGEALSRRFRLRAGPTLALKGISAPVHTVIPVARHVRSAGPRLVAREAEQVVLAEAMEAASAGSPRLLAMEGEAGIGKSALIARVVADALARGRTVCTTTADPLQRQIPLAAIGRLVAQRLGVTRADPPEVIAAAVAQRLAGMPEVWELAPLLSACLLVGLPENSLTGRLRGSARVDATRRVILTLLEIGGPLLAVVDDAQWLDSASWAIVAALARHGSGLLVVASRPAGPDASDWRALLRTPGCQHLRLEPLDRAGMVSLVKAHLGVLSVDRALVNAAVQRTEGHPFFAEEWLESLRRAGRLIVRDGVAALAGGVEQPGLPNTVQGLLTGRVDALDPMARRALKAASVLGSGFSLPAMQAVFPEAGDKVTGLLEGLVRAGLLVRSGAAGAFGFRHALVRDAAYALMLPGQRRGIHQAAGEWLERQSANELAAVAARLAEHFSQAGVSHKTIYYADLAADVALSVGAYREARRFLERCLTLASDAATPEDPLRGVRWRRRLSEAYHGLGDMTGCGQHAARAVELAGGRVPRERPWATVLAGSGLLQRSLSTPRAGRGVAGAARDRELELARAYSGLAVSEFFQNRAVTTLLATLRGLKHAERVGLSPELVRATTELAGAFGLVPLAKRAASLFDAALTLSEALGDPAASVYVHMVNGLYRLGVGAFGKAWVSIERCQEGAERLGDELNWCNAQVMRFWWHHYRGEGEAASVEAEVLLSRAAASGNRQQEGWGLRSVAMYDISAGRLALAMDRLSASLEMLADYSGDLGEVVPSRGALAAARMQLGDKVGAAEAALEALKGMRGIAHPVGHGTLEGYASTFETALRAWDESWPDPPGATWRDLAHEAVLGLKRYRGVFPVGAPRWYWARAELMRRRGRPGAASGLARRGLRAAEALGMRGERARLEAICEPA